MRRSAVRLAPYLRKDAHAQVRYSSSSGTGATSKLGSWDGSIVHIEPGQHVHAVAKQYNIGFPDKLRPLKNLRLDNQLGKNPYKIGASVCQQHLIDQLSMRYFDKFEHPFTKTMLDKYIERKKESLWLNTHAHGAGVFPNKKASKKIMHALRDALAAAGYDRFGQTVLTDGQSRPKGNMYGTLRVVCQAPTVVCEAKFVDLLETAKRVIAAAAAMLQTDQHGRHLNLTKSQPHSPASQRQKLGPKTHQERRAVNPRAI
ncbi:hypothetical protein F4808DRAFT_97315 [Astrocystis sublimbata]|nr:hypothetical protein F4808DRAFT_97315 [Astrocystis sublimbata]